MSLIDFICIFLEKYKRTIQALTAQKLEVCIFFLTIYDVMIIWNIENKQIKLISRRKKSFTLPNKRNLIFKTSCLKYIGLLHISDWTS